MQSLLIRGGKPLAGEIPISGSKNAVLPMLAATVLFRRECTIHNCPALSDVEDALAILRFLGAQVRRQGSIIRVNPEPVCRWDIPGELMGKMRGSVFFTGPLLARFGKCRLTQPGGCPLGSRPVDFHAMGITALGGKPEEGGVYAGKLLGTRIHLPYPSVGATENLLMAALGAQGTTIITNAAREPEIVCLCDFLRSGGCVISGDGSDTIVIQGGLPDQGEAKVIPDRMEAASFACAVASAGGEGWLRGAEHTHLTPVLQTLEQAGCGIRTCPEGIFIRAGKLSSPEQIITGPYPAFPTDAQAPMMAALLRSSGTTIVKETVFSDRMNHISELTKLGAVIHRWGSTACIRGVEQLCGATVEAKDLRCGAALAIAGLAASGETRVKGLHHLMRGYENFAGKLRALGARVEPV